jgi:hypothetical protein
MKYGIPAWMMATNEPGHTFFLVGSDGKGVWLRDYGAMEHGGVMYVKPADIVTQIKEALVRESPLGTHLPPHPLDDLAAAAVGSGQFRDAQREDDQGPEQEHERGERMRRGVIAEAGEKEADEAAQKGAPRKHIPSAVLHHRCRFHCRSRTKPPAS